MSELPAKTVLPFEGDMLELKHLLELESRTRPGEWARRVLGEPVTGTFVGMRLNTRRRCWELMIWQERVPATLGQHTSWERRVNELRHQLRCTSWRRLDDVIRDDRVAATFTQSIHDPADLKR